MREIYIKKNEAQQRLDKLLLKYLNQAPKSFVYKMLRKKNITLNEKKADGSEQLKEGDCIKLYLAEDTIEKFSCVSVPIYPYSLDILYEDENILIVNKEAGVLSQKAKPEDISLVEQIQSYLLDTHKITQEERKSFHPGICNRLDRNTSGIILAGKSLEGLRELSALLKERTLDKYYFCIVKGVLAEKKELEGYLRKDKSHNRVSVLEKPFQGAEYIKTVYEPISNNGKVTLLQIKLVTGRSHQIRAHLHSIGHPIVGDGKYGDVAVNRYFKKTYQLNHQLLHAAFIHFPKQTGILKALSETTVYAPLPVSFQEIIKGEKLCLSGKQED